MPMIQRIQSAPPVWKYPEYRPTDKTAIFVPCYIDQFYPHAAVSMVEILDRLGVRIDFPSGQTCCGQPAFNSGAWDEARKVVRVFAKTFADYDWIICPSGSCTAMCRVFFEHLFPDDPEITGVGKRVVELTEFLVNVLGVTELGARFPQKVTLHIGCHGRRELGITDQPVKLLKNVRDLEYIELPHMEDCCGFGGTFSVKFPNLSLDMGRAKCENIASTGASVVASIDTSCLMHIGGILQLDPQKKKIRPMHIAEILNCR
ncbi:MAG: (Fe-S)-binding protein [Thermoguttaceae bacterium]|nr:(Fe-S)-binding protein [Thermoguttaceae bacterium]